MEIRIFIPILLLVVASLYGQEDSSYTGRIYSLEEITVTATKLETQLKDEPTKVEIIDALRVENSNGARLAEVLKQSSLVFVKSYGLSPALQTISINGLGAEHSLILIDGIRINSFQNSHLDLSLIPKNNIDRIEIINNGVSSIYGSDAMGGVVNIISKKTEKLSGGRSTKLDASYSIGSFNTKGYSFGLYQQFEGLSAKVYFDSETSDGDYEYYFNNGTAKILKERENAAYKLNDAGINAQYVIDRDNIIRMISNFSYQDKNLPGIETGSPPASTNQIDKNWNNVIFIENRLSERVAIRSSLNFQNNLTRYKTEPFVNSFYKNIVYSAATELNLRGSGHGFSTGYNFSNAELASNDVAPGAVRNQHAVFLSAFHDILDLIKVYPSLRYDYITDIETGAFTYKLGINIQPFPGSGFGVRGNIGRNFRTPSFNDLYWNETGNRDLNPEKSMNAEAGLFYSFNLFLDGSFDITYTLIHAEDKIIWLPGPGGLWMPDNIAESVSENLSLKASLKKTITDKFEFRLDAGFGILDSKKTSESYPGDPSKDKYTPFIPLQSAKINFGVQFIVFELNLFYSHVGERYSDFANTKALPPVNLLDGNIGVSTILFGVESKIRFETNNIFDTDYQTIPGYPMPLRNYKLNFSISY